MSAYAAETPEGAAGPLEIARWDGAGSEWDRFVEGSAPATFCHLAGWREIMADALGHECHYLVARETSGAWRGVLPLVRMRGLLFGHHLVSMPFLNDGGPVGTAKAQQALVDAAVALARRSGAATVELRPRHALPTLLAPARNKVSVHLPLPESASRLWDGLPAKLRSQVRRPIKEGMAARFGPAERDAFYAVFSRNMRDLGTPVLPAAFFERIAATFAARVVFGAVYHQGVPVAAGCGFQHGEEFELSWASSLREHNRLAPNMLLYWAFMEDAIARGARVFNFGRCTPGGSTHRFKLQWRGEDRPLPWVRWPESATDAPPATERPAFQLAIAGWKRLPLAVANGLGPILARQAPWL